MGRFDDISMDELQGLRENTTGEIPRERVLAAIARTQGDDIERLAERHGVVEKTIRNWLDRFVERPIEEAPYDDPRPGAPGKLGEDERERLFEDFNTRPTVLGYDRETWTSSLARHHIDNRFDVEYSERHARYLMERAELSRRTRGPG